MPRLISILFFVFAAAASAGPKSPSSKPEPIAPKMRKLAEGWSRLVPLLFEENAAPDELVRELRGLAESAKGIDLSMHTKNSDPIFALIGSSLARDLERTSEIADSGRLEQARDWARSSLAACVACHSRHVNGPQFAFNEKLGPALAKAPWWERVSFEAATRQYEPALAEITKQLAAPSQPAGHLMEMEKAVRIGLMVAVRAKNDPVAAGSLAEEVLNSPWATVSMKDRAKAWKKDVAAWKVAPKPQPGLASARALLTAKDLEGVRSDEGDLRWLRASALLHAFLAENPPAKERAEAYFLLGSSYDLDGDLGFWSVGDRYFESCVREVPHTELAEKCYARYEESLKLGYTGSRGVFIPAAVRKQLESIKELSKRAAK